MNRTEFTYRRTAAEGTNGFGLLVALYDTLAGDLRRAAEAQRANDIPGRCRELDHALRVIGHLENWVNTSAGGDLAQQLIAFYSGLRRRLIEASVKQSSEMLHQQMVEVLKVRESWQQLELEKESSGPEIIPPSAQRPVAYTAMQTENYQSNWSA